MDIWDVQWTKINSFDVCYRKGLPQVTVGTKIYFIGFKTSRFITGDKAKIKWRYDYKLDRNSQIKWVLTSFKRIKDLHFQMKSITDWNMIFAYQQRSWHDINRHPFQFDITRYPPNKCISQSPCDSPGLEQKLKSCFAKFSKSWTKKAKRHPNES